MTGAPQQRFQTTRWSMVLEAIDAGRAEGSSALATLCETYWWPVFAFVRKRGYSEEDARDLTQAFFTRELERPSLKGARPELGRFRSYLLGAVQHFLADQRDRAAAAVRGGGVTHVSLDAHTSADPLASDRAIGETPERAFERCWAQATVDRAIARVAEEYARAGRRTTFDTLRPAVDGDERVDYARAAVVFGSSEGAVRVAVHRLRRHVAAALRATLAETVANDHDVADELEFLKSVLAATSSASSLFSPR
jgi:RNA polymerase sigma factor (sigma-70 family)